MADGQARASKVVAHGATPTLVGIDDHHRTLHTGSTVLQREVDRSHGSMAAALQGHPMDASDVRVDDVPTPRIDDRGLMLRKP